jgi:hypothetical protein
MRSAGQEIQAAAIAALKPVAGLSGAYAGPPLTAMTPYATVEAGPETDWSHKSGKGREVRLAVTVRDRGERADRLQEIAAAVEAALESMAAEMGGWRIVSLQFLRSRTVPAGKGSAPEWAAVIEYRARLLAA